MRIEELLIIKIENINLEEGYWVGGLKTSAGKDRLIPLCSCILPIIKRYYNSNNIYLFTMEDGKRLHYDKYRKMYKEFMDSLELEEDYTTHEIRYTFRTELDRLGADVKCIDLIMGHEDGNTGNRVYNARTIQELKDTVETIDYRKKKDVKVVYFKKIKSA